MGYFFYALASFLFDFISQGTGWGRHHHFEMFGIFTITEFILIATFFYVSINYPLVKRIILLASIVLVLFLIFAFVISHKNNFDSISASIESVTIIILSIIYFWEQINKPPNFFIYSSANFWIVLAFMMYMSGVLFLFILASNLSPQRMIKYWSINNFLNIFTNIIFSVAFLVSRFVPRNVESEHFSQYNHLVEEL